MILLIIWKIIKRRNDEKIFDKLKQLAKTSLFKASIWSILITLLIFVPFLS